MLRVAVVTKLPPDTDRLIKEWSALADACPYSTVFQTPEWLATWWSTIGRASSGRSLHLITVHDDATLIGVVPLMMSSWHGLPLRRLSFIGAGVTDYNDAIAAPGREDDVCAALYAHLRQKEPSAVLDLRELRDGGLLRERAPSATEGLAYSDWPLENCPYLDLPTSGTADERWKALLGDYSKKMRGNVGYYERTLRRAFEVEDRVISDPGQLRDALGDLFELHKRRWNQRWLPGAFNNKKVRIFHLQAARKLLERGCLRLHLLLLDGEVQAALYAFAYHDRTCYYQGGFEPEMARYSLGSVLIARTIRAAIEEGFPTFDFLRGNEEYKQRWTHGRSHTNIRRLITLKGSAQLAVAERIHRVETSLEMRAKALFAGGIVNRAIPQQQQQQREAAQDRE